MNEENKLPELIDPPEFLSGENWFEAKIDDDLLDFSEPYKPPRYMLSHDGIPFANIGDLHVVSGKSGHGKTNFMSQLMATILCGRFGKMRYEQSASIPKPVILYIDTEQGKDDTIAVKNRVCTMANIDYSKPCDQFKILRLRDTEDAKVRWKKILKAVWLLRPNVIFLDGILDIVYDYNSQEECSPIIRQCMMISTHYDASLWLVLHENPLQDKLVGTLGSITQRKATEVFTVRKHKQADERQRVPNRPDVYFTIKQMKARGRDAKDWDFEVIPGAGGWGMPVELDDTGAIVDPKDQKLYQEIKEADDIFKEYAWPKNGSNYVDLERFLHSKGITSNRRIGHLFNIAKEYRVIYQNEKRKYFYSGFQSDIPNDLPNNLPFLPTNEEPPY